MNNRNNFIFSLIFVKKHPFSVQNKIIFEPHEPKNVT